MDPGVNPDISGDYYELISLEEEVLILRYILFQWQFTRVAPETYYDYWSDYSGTYKVLVSKCKYTVIF